jgi:CheY-like chemotaxis protein
MPADTPNVISVALTRPSRAQRTVLVVDDEPGVRDTLGRLLRQAGYQTREAGSAVDALKVIEHEPVHATRRPACEWR